MTVGCGFTCSGKSPVGCHSERLDFFGFWQEATPSAELQIQLSRVSRGGQALDACTFPVVILRASDQDARRIST